jgi:hypothetical protein
MKLPAIHIAAVILLSACGHLNPEVPVSFLGDPVPVEAASSTIVVQSDTKWVNVTGGDIVRFDVGGKSFAWSFNVATGVTNFDLAKVAPPGILSRPLQAYVAPDPKYMGGDGDRID